MKGWFDAFRDDGAPTLYSFSNRTPVIGDVSIIVVSILFATFYTAFLVIFPGVRKQVLMLTSLDPNQSNKFLKNVSFSTEIFNIHHSHVKPVCWPSHIRWVLKLIITLFIFMLQVNTGDDNKITCGF